MNLDDDGRRAALATLGTRLAEMAAEYRGEVSDRFKLKAQAVMSAQTVVEAHRISLRVIDSFQVHLLASWACKRIPGPARTDPQRADEAEKLAVFLDDKGDRDGAQKQRERARRLRS